MENTNQWDKMSEDELKKDLASKEKRISKEEIELAEDIETKVDLKDLREAMAEEKVLEKDEKHDGKHIHHHYV